MRDVLAGLMALVLLPMPSAQALRQQQPAESSAGIERTGGGTRNDDERDADRAGGAAQAAQEEWRDLDDAARTLSATAKDPCSREVEQSIDAAHDGVKRLIDLQRATYRDDFEWYGKRYTSASTLLGGFQPSRDTLDRQLSALMAESDDFKRREQSLRGENTDDARAALREIRQYKVRQIDNVTQALGELDKARRKVQDDRVTAGRVRAKIAEILASLDTETDLFGAYYRHQKASANLRCTIEGRPVIDLPPLGLPTGGSR